MNLIVICSDYPVGKGNAEASLLKFQLNSIENIFKNIILLPTVSLRKKDVISGLNHTIIYNFRRFRLQSFFDFFLNIHYLLNDIIKIKINEYIIFSIFNSFTAYLKSIYLYSFLKNYIKSQNLNNNVAIYSFWFGDATLGAIMLKKKYPSLIVFSGAHGYDLFEERHPGNRIPFRQVSLNLIDKVIVCSSEGISYLEDRYNQYKNKFKLVNSGVRKKNKMVKSSKDGIFRILTLSRTDPIKRLAYLLKSLKKIEGFSEFKIEYCHIGGDHKSGEQELQKLKKLSKELNFKWFKVKFLGKISDDELNHYFKNSIIDVFLNVSSSEGTCLSLVEAMSYSIPVVVTAVGGNISIGNISNTRLNVNFSPYELYEYLRKINNDKEYREKLKSNSYKYWFSNHNSETLSSEINDIFKMICSPT